MVGSIELLFDEQTETRLRECWAALTEAGLPSQGRLDTTTNRPHVTLAVADRISARVDDELREYADRLPLPCTIGALVVFGEHRLTLAKLIVPSAELLALQRAVYQRCVPHLVGDPKTHTAPDHWTPHVTLGRRLDTDQLGAACRLPAVLRELSGRFEAIRRWDGAARVEHRLIG